MTLFNFLIIFYVNIFNIKFIKEFTNFINIIISFMILNVYIRLFIYITSTINFKNFIRMTKSNHIKFFKII